MEELLERFYPDIFVHLKEIEHNMTVNIEDYFGREIIMIKAGHGGFGYNLRILQGYHTEDRKYPEKYLRILKPKKNGITSMMSICEVKGWEAEIILTDRVPHISNLIEEKLKKCESRNNGYIGLLNLKHIMRSFIE